jgi:hypothetical protein
VPTNKGLICWPVSPFPSKRRSPRLASRPSHHGVLPSEPVSNRPVVLPCPSRWRSPSPGLLDRSFEAYPEPAFRSSRPSTPAGIVLHALPASLVPAAPPVRTAPVRAPCEEHGGEPGGGVRRERPALQPQGSSLPRHVDPVPDLQMGRHRFRPLLVFPQSHLRSGREYTILLFCSLPSLHVFARVVWLVGSGSCRRLAM